MLKIFYHKTYAKRETNNKNIKFCSHKLLHVLSCSIQTERHHELCRTAAGWHNSSPSRDAVPSEPSISHPYTHTTKGITASSSWSAFRVPHEVRGQVSTSHIGTLVSCTSTVAGTCLPTLTRAASLEQHRPSTAGAALDPRTEGLGKFIPPSSVAVLLTR